MILIVSSMKRQVVGLDCKQLIRKELEWHLDRWKSSRLHSSPTMIDQQLEPEMEPCSWTLGSLEMGNQDLRTRRSEMSMEALYLW